MGAGKSFRKADYAITKWMASWPFGLGGITQVTLCIGVFAGFLYSLGLAGKKAWSASGLHEKFDWMNGDSNPIGLIDMLLEPTVSPFIAGIPTLFLFCLVAVIILAIVTKKNAG